MAGLEAHRTAQHRDRQRGTLPLPSLLSAGHPLQSRVKVEVCERVVAVSRQHPGSLSSTARPRCSRRGGGAGGRQERSRAAVCLLTPAPLSGS